jgi:hypothetical protein
MYKECCITNFRHKLQCNEDLQTEAVVELFRRAWQKQQQAASFCEDEHSDTIGGIGEELVRIYMRQAAPPIQPAAIEQRTMRGGTRERSHPGAVRYPRRGWDDHCYQHGSECAERY